MNGGFMIHTIKTFMNLSRDKNLSRELKKFEVILL